MDAVVIGAGPAGLMAAEAIADQGYKVLVVEAKPSVGRKLLMAGKSGLNLTTVEDFDVLVSRYADAADWVRPHLKSFDDKAVVAWATDLGQTVFTGSSGRVFPQCMKSSPLLRSWLQRLDRKGVSFKTRWLWTGFAKTGLAFNTPDGLEILAPQATVLALGGASWPRLGSTGAWTTILGEAGVIVSPWQPANMGLAARWTDHMKPHFGCPVKSVRLTAGDQSVVGEFVVTGRGLEGSGIYAVSREVRDGKSLDLDLMPDVLVDQIAQRLAARKPKETLTHALRRCLKLPAIKIALLQEWARPLPNEPDALAGHIKALTVQHAGPRPIAEAISSAGGVAQAAVDDALMLRALPGIFVSGEMLDWEAPTGGYLLTACLATGRAAGLGAAGFLADRTSGA